MGNEDGFTLIEVLVALFVLALGVLGAVGMQMSAMRTRHESSLMSNAVHLASGLADQMRANTDQMGHGDAGNPYLNLRYDAATDGAPGQPAALCYSLGSNCSSAQLASFDIYELEQSLFATLPGARVVVCRDAQVWDGARAALSWQCAGTIAAPIVIKLGWRGKNPDGSATVDEAGQFAPSVAITLAGVVN